MANKDLRDYADAADTTLADMFLERITVIDRKYPGFPITPRGTAYLLQGVMERPQAETIAHSVLMQLVERGNLLPSPNKLALPGGDWLPYYILVLPAEIPMAS